MFYSNDIKEVVARVAVLGVLLMIAVGCNSSTDDEQSSGGAKSDIQVSDALVEAVQTGVSEQEVRDALGEPNMVIPITDPPGEGWLFSYGDGEESIVWFENGKVSRVDTKGY